MDRVVVLVLRALLRAYQLFLSPLLGSACRFSPTCSHYAREALDRHGAMRGSWLAARRVARCHPFAAGGIDPVPAGPLGSSTPVRDSGGLRRPLVAAKERDA